MLSFAENHNTSGGMMADEFTNTLMILCRGKRADYSGFWAYMCIKPSNAKAFTEARAGGMVSLEDYGTVLEWGEGNEPPDDVKLRMERDFGMNHNFEAELLRAIMQNE